MSADSGTNITGNDATQILADPTPEYSDQESDIRADVAALKEQYPARKDLSVAVAKLLFLKYGRMPTVALVRQYTERGSSTNINTDLKAFWGVLRDKLKLNVIAPDVPEGLVEYAGEMMSSFWARASEEARKVLDDERAEIEAQRQADKQAVEMAQYERDRSIEDANKAVERASTAESEREDAERALAVDRETFETKEVNYLERIADLERRLSALGQEKANIEKRFTDELEKMRIEREQSEAFLNGQNIHAMNMVEEARQQTRDEKERVRVQKADFDLKENILRQQMNGLRESLSTASNAAAEFKAKYESVSAERDRLIKQSEAQAKAVESLNSTIEKMVLQQANINSTSEKQEESDIM